MERVVAGLLPATSRFVMTRNPTTIQQALDYAQIAGVLEQDGSNDKVGVTLVSLTEQIRALQMDLNRIQKGMTSLVPNRPQSARRPPASHASARLRPQAPPFRPREHTSRVPAAPTRGARNPFTRQRTLCQSCGGNHIRETCRFRFVRCHFCQVVGHTAACCRKRQGPQ